MASSKTGPGKSIPKRRKKETLHQQNKKVPLNSARYKNCNRPRGGYLYKAGRVCNHEGQIIIIRIIIRASEGQCEAFYNIHWRIEQGEKKEEEIPLKRKLHTS